MASITCSHARSVASEQFKNSPTPKRAKTFKPKYTNGLKNNGREKHHVKAGTSDVVRSDSFDKETSKTLKIKGGRKMLHIFRLHISNLSKTWPRLQIITSSILSDVILVCL